MNKPDYKEVQWKRYGFVHLVDLNTNPHAVLCAANKYKGKYLEWDRWWTPPADSNDHRCRGCQKRRKP